MAARVVSYARSSWIDDYRAARIIRRFQDRFESRLGLEALSVALDSVTVHAYLAAGRRWRDPLTLRLLRGFPRIVRKRSA